MPLHLRPAVPSDAVPLADLYLRARAELAAYAPLAHPEAGVRAWIANVLIPSGGVTVATEDRQLLGMSAHTSADGVVWLDQLYVCPSRKRRGIGTALLNHVKSQTPGMLQLYTFQPNLAAIAFYERHGFVAIGYGDGSENEEHCPDALYRWTRHAPTDLAD
ncbi:GNAT family N-acetyltransferase [Burkholderia alba]|uniref:GNAT family N-acetyltransferase n=1 Tax=Burkholderia alba TaxID=2683677 RepID=UPI002B05593E|nr:GNAT family N-acetyltransferase [Burkholderia alba]